MADSDNTLISLLSTTKFSTYREFLVFGLNHDLSEIVKLMINPPSHPEVGFPDEKKMQERLIYKASRETKVLSEIYIRMRQRENHEDFWSMLKFNSFVRFGDLVRINLSYSRCSPKKRRYLWKWLNVSSKNLERVSLDLTDPWLGMHARSEVSMDSHKKHTFSVQKFTIFGITPGDCAVLALREPIKSAEILYLSVTWPTIEAPLAKLLFSYIVRRNVKSTFSTTKRAFKRYIADIFIHDYVFNIPRTKD